MAVGRERGTQRDMTVTREVGDVHSTRRGRRSPPATLTTFQLSLTHDKVGDHPCLPAQLHTRISISTFVLVARVTTNPADPSNTRDARGIQMNGNKPNVGPRCESPSPDSPYLGDHPARSDHRLSDFVRESGWLVEAIQRGSNSKEQACIRLRSLSKWLGGMQSVLAYPGIEYPPEVDHLFDEVDALRTMCELAAGPKPIREG